MIKLFEEYKDISMDDYYQEISKEEYEVIHKLEWSNFTDKEIVTLRNMVNGVWWRRSWDSEFHLSDGESSILISGRDRVLRIVKLEDEWYYVQFHKPIGIGYRKKFIVKWYKCDQLEGLIKFLKNI